MKSFNLKKFRLGYGLTLKVISEKTGIHQIHLSEIERGLRPISALQQEKIKASFPRAGAGSNEDEIELEAATD